MPYLYRSKFTESENYCFQLTKIVDTPILSPYWVSQRPGAHSRGRILTELTGCAIIVSALPEARILACQI